MGAADARATAAVTAAVWRELTERGFVVVEDALDAATVEAAAREAAALREAGLLHCGACEPPDEVGESECGPGGLTRDLVERPSVQTYHPRCDQMGL